MPKTASADSKIAKIKKLRDSGLSWAAVAEQVELTPSQAMLQYEQADGAHKISGRTDAELAKNIVRARRSGLSWGIIMGRSGIGEQKLRRIYEEETGELASNSKIGKGGRTPGSGTSPGPAKKAVKKASKKAPVKKAAKKAPAAKKAAPVKKAVKKKAPAKKAASQESA